MDETRDQNNAWVEATLKDHNGASGGGARGHGSAALPLDCTALAPLEGHLSAAVLTDATLPALVEESTMSRATVGEGPRALAFNVYLDNFTGGGARQRGLGDCHATGASKYQPVHDESVEQLCSWSYLWLPRGPQNHDMDRAARLQWEPRRDDVQALMGAVRTCPI